MRALFLLPVFVCEVAAARPPPREIPALERNCAATASRAALLKCIARHEKSATVRSLSSEVELVLAADAHVYLFVRFGEAWQLVYRPGDASYELVGSSELTFRTTTARQIDLAHYVAIDRHGVFLERVSLVCPRDTRACSAYVTACTVMESGRAVETFRGKLEPTADGVTLVGDRSHTGAICRSR